MLHVKLVCLALCFIALCAAEQDFYELLGIDRSANTKDIRKAFKRVALKMHPDKNADDPDADRKFARINRAYEVLKDEDLRKKYDQFGEEGLENKHSGHAYHPWNYYNDNFGIYDDDPEIITLSRTDFEASVSSSNTPWFINFYHPMCSHCHTLAPDWRWLSIELQGVIRIGAVNCDDEFHLCSEQNIHGYPSLLAYPGREKFQLDKSRDNLVNFILKRLPTGEGIPVTQGMLYNMKQQMKHKKKDQKLGTLSSTTTKPWLLAVFRTSDEYHEHRITLMKLAAMFSGVIKVGRVDCWKDDSLCSTLNITARTTATIGPTIFYYPDSPLSGGRVALSSETAQELAKEALGLMPDIPLIEDQEFEERLSSLTQSEEPDSPGWLVQFSSNGDDEEVEFRKVPGLASPIPCHRVLCSRLSSNACDLLFLTKTPAFVLFKPGGGYEIHHGRLLAQDISNFAREAATAKNFRTLTPKEFPSILSNSGHWFIDFYAPWCPPCMRLLPIFRKASMMIQEEGLKDSINFGIVDCTTHGNLCSEYNIRSYPTTIFYNHSTPHQYNGHHSEHHIVEFVKDTLSPTVIPLTPETFQSHVFKRGESEIWVVDFFASWCGPCMAMAPEYRKFGRLVSNVPGVHVTSMDCALYREFCNSQNVRSYPTVRLYGRGSPGSHSVYQEYSRDAQSFKRWLYSHLPSKVKVLNEQSFEEILQSSDPWLVDFYADWCGPCRQFAPEFEDLARKLDDVVRLAKLDCQSFNWVCRSAGVRAYPSVVFYPGVKGGQRKQQPHGELIDSMHAAQIHSIVLNKVEQGGGSVSGDHYRDEL